ncbi:hypothetical protein P9112_002852 [Eukaryota sp. TZLM1-RC]
MDFSDFSFDIDEAGSHIGTTSTTSKSRVGESITTFSLKCSSSSASPNIEVAHPPSPGVTSSSAHTTSLPEPQENDNFDYDTVPVASFGMRYLQSMGLDIDNIDSDSSKSRTFSSKSRHGLGFSSDRAAKRTFSDRDLQDLPSAKVGDVLIIGGRKVEVIKLIEQNLVECRDLASNEVFSVEL